jgi:HEAT repeat protein
VIEEQENDLAGRLESEDEEIRSGALDEVAAEHEAAYLPHVVASLYHHNPEIRKKAATALRGIKDNRVGDIAMLALAVEKDPEVIFDLIMVFLYRPKKEAVDELLPYLDYPDYRVRSAAVDVLGALGSVFGRSDIVRPLLPLIGDPRPSVVMVTLRALMHLAEALTDRALLMQIIEETGKLEANPNRMVVELAASVRGQLKEQLTLQGED